MHAPMEVLASACLLKQRSALASSELHHANELSRRRAKLSSSCAEASRAWRNLCHSTHRLARQLPLEAAAEWARVSDGLCELPAPSIPPPQLRCFLSAYGSLLTVLRREPEAVAAAVHYAGASAATAVPLLLGCVWAHVWRVDDALGAADAPA